MLLNALLNNPSDIRDISEAIHDAVAPVFLLTGIGSILGVLVNRLGRSIDRARVINAMSYPRSLNSVSAASRISCLRTSGARRVRFLRCDFSKT